MGWLDNNGLAHFWAQIKTTLANYALKSELPTKTSDLTNDSGYLTSHQDISMKADSATTLSGYGITDAYTKSEVDTAISNIPVENADWAENDTTSSAYVENRTHYVERTPLTEVLTYNTEVNDEYYQISYPDEEWAKSLNEGDAYSLTLNETIFTGNIKRANSEIGIYYYLGNLALQSMGEDTGEPFLLVLLPNYNMIILFLSEVPSSGVDMSLSLSSLIIHKLDSKYLDGSLILSGEEVYSEIFNGESSVLTEYIAVSGNAGSTSYTFYSYNYLKSLLEHIYDKVTIKDYEDVSIMNYSFDDSNLIGTLTLSKTLDENNNLKNKSIVLVIPNKMGLGAYSHIEGVSGWTFGQGSHTEGSKTVAISNYSHAEGFETIASEQYSHAEGSSTTASGQYSHAEGSYAKASGQCSHAEGSSTTASGECSHAEGRGTIATGVYSHAEGNGTTASGQNSHTEGESTTASAYCSHTEGLHSIASAYYSHAEGFYTTARGRSQHVFGEYNISDGDETTSNNNKVGEYIEIVGNGTSDNARSNARTLDWSGNETLAGKLTVGANPTNNMDVATKQYVDSAVSSSGSSYQFYATDDSNGTVTIHFGTSS